MQAPATPGAPLLWKVQPEAGGDAVLWLFGTVHDAGRDAIPAEAWAALDGAPRFVSELGDLEPDPDAVRELVRIRRGKGLDRQLSSDRWFELVNALRGTIAEAELARARPWYALSLLVKRYAPSPSPTMDEALVEWARGRGLAIEHLETFEAQLAAVDAAVGIPQLVDGLDARETMRCERAASHAAYVAGDLATMTASYGADRSGQLLEARNRAWMAALEAHLAGGGGGAFVAVGIGHLVGPRGLPALLDEAGFVVERVLHSGP